MAPSKEYVSHVLDQLSDAGDVSSRAMMSDIRSIADNPAWMGEAAEWFSEKWGIPAEAYRESMEESHMGRRAVPQWYVVREGDGPSHGARQRNAAGLDTTPLLTAAMPERSRGGRPKP